MERVDRCGASAGATILSTLAIVLGACSGAGDETPLAGLLGWDASGVEREIEFASLDDRAEALIAACMAEQGFEYIPTTMDFGGVSYPADELDPDEFRERYGYGIATVDRSREAAGGVTAAVDESANERLRDALGDADRLAYDLALKGGPEEAPGVDGRTFGGGCFGDANEQVYITEQAARDELHAMVHELWSRVRADPRVVAAHGAWSAYMADHGYDVATRHEARLLIDERRWELEEAATAAIDWTLIDPDDPAQSHEEHMDVDALAALQAEELRVAAADHDCARAHLEVEEQVRAELEAAFVEEHRDLIDQVAGR